jgi:hypothetical protein
MPYYSKEKKLKVNFLNSNDSPAAQILDKGSTGPID